MCCIGFLVRQQHRAACGKVLSLDDNFTARQGPVSYLRHRIHYRRTERHSAEPRSNCNITADLPQFFKSQKHITVYNVNNTTICYKVSAFHNAMVEFKS